MLRNEESWVSFPWILIKGIHHRVNKTPQALVANVDECLVDKLEKPNVNSSYRGVKTREHKKTTFQETTSHEKPLHSTNWMKKELRRWKVISPESKWELKCIFFSGAIKFVEPRRSNKYRKTPFAICYHCLNVILLLFDHSVVDVRWLRRLYLRRWTSTKQWRWNRRNKNKPRCVSYSLLKLWQTTDRLVFIL